MHSSTNNISDEVVKNLNKLASHRQIRKFREAFNNLSPDHRQNYCDIVAVNGNGLAISQILIVMAKDQAVSAFHDLLAKNRGLAFNTLDSIGPKYTLFKTLFNQLNPQQKKDYRVHLETKPTIKAEFVLRNFYLNNKESSSNLRTETLIKIVYR